MHLVLSGKRNLSLKAIETIENHFKWQAREKKYFHWLVLLNQSHNSVEKKEFQENLDHLKGGNKNLVRPDQEIYFSIFGICRFYVKLFLWKILFPIWAGYQRKSSEELEKKK